MYKNLKVTTKINKLTALFLAVLITLTYLPVSMFSVAAEEEEA